MNQEKVVIIIPTYNEALVIENTLSQVFAAITTIAGKDIHVLVFDSHSKDTTALLVANLQTTYSRLHLVTEAKKSGLGSAYLQAMRYALHELSADIVMEFDADLSHQPQYIKPMLECLIEYDVVVGSRYIHGGSIPNEWGWHRKLLSKVGNQVARLVLTSSYKDLTSGFRATRRSALLRVLPDTFLTNHYAYKMQLMWLLHQSKARITEYPIDFIDRQKGKSKLPTNSIIDSLRVLLLLRIPGAGRYLKMCLVGLSGMLVQGVAYNFLRQFVSPVSAVQWAVMLAIINNYFLNGRFTFKQATRPKKPLKTLLVFVVFSLLMINLQSYWLYLGLKYLGSGYVNENIILLLGMIFGSLLNYLTYSRVVWRMKKPDLQALMNSSNSM